MPAVEIYRNVSAMEPLLPSTGDAVLAELTAEIFYHAGRLDKAAHPITAEQVAQVVRQMNSYYSNLIEGHRTLPRDIEKALRQNFSKNPKKKHQQQLGLAHLEVESLINERITAEPTLQTTSLEFICFIHREFYLRLPEELRITEGKDGKTYPIAPGQIRNYMVDVGSHTAPSYEHLDSFLKRFNEFYDSHRIIATRRLVAAAAAHHRLLWIHPFGDGNGRVARLFTHAYLKQIPSLGKQSLWTISRGLARNQQTYFSLLSDADEQRQSDTDGRGNLSEKSLFNFVKFFLETILDQIQFMGTILDLDKLSHRVETHLTRDSVFGKESEKATRLITHALTYGEVRQEEAERIINRKENTTRALLKKIEKAGYLSSEKKRGTYRISFTSDMLEDYFPKLFMPTANA